MGEYILWTILIFVSFKPPSQDYRFAYAFILLYKAFCLYFIILSSNGSFQNK